MDKKGGGGGVWQHLIMAEVHNSISVFVPFLCSIAYSDFSFSG